MSDRFHLNELLDVYGPLLTAKQQKIADLYLREDCSYQEIAQMEGISRSAVYDTIHKCTTELENYEALLGIVTQSINRIALYGQIEKLTQDNNILVLLEELRKTETQEVL